MVFEKRIQIPPKGLVGACLLFWGLLVDQLVWAIIAALLVESHHFVKARWELREKQFTNYWNVSIVILLVTLLIPVINNPRLVTFNDQFVWFPLTMLPIVLAQCYSETQTVPLRTFFISQQLRARRLRKKGGVPKPSSEVNVLYAYCMVAILSASLNEHASGTLYFIGSVLLIFVVLISMGKKNVGWPVFLAGWGIVIFSGYWGQVGLHYLHRELEKASMAFFENWMQLDPLKTVTRIGQIGDAKGQNEIIWRVQPIEGEHPFLLKEATYDTYREGVWFNGNRENFVTRIPRIENDIIVHNTVDSVQTNGLSKAKLLGIPRTNRVFLPLAHGTQRLEGLDALNVESNKNSMLRISEFSSLIRVTAAYGELYSMDSAPAPEHDLRIPEEDFEAISRVVDSLGLIGQPVEEQLARIERFFIENFRYSTYLTIKEKPWTREGSPISQFLNEVRTGHCEYFACATALLLRGAGVPARYCIGFSVQEYVPSKKMYYVRGLHGHAWAQAWVDGQWVQVDNTPPDWTAIEMKEATLAQRIQDWFNGLYLAYQTFRIDGLSDAARRNLIIGVLFVLGIYIPVRLWTSGGRRKTSNLEDTETFVVEVYGQNSPLHEFEAIFDSMGLPRRQAETWADWWGRSNEALPSEFNKIFPQLLKAHYAMRFQARGLSEGELREMAGVVKECKVCLGSKIAN